MPQNPFVVATKGPTNDVCVFDISKHPSTPAPGSGCNPEHRCKGHQKEGYGLAWNSLKAGGLISGSEDQLICHWDVASGAGKEIQPLRTWSGQKSVVADVAWHNRNANLFGSVGYDGSLMIWDLGVKGDNPAFQVPKAHDGEGNCLVSPTPRCP
jgi:WD40 repeat protein